MIAGTVFRDPGFAQPGATVSLALKSAPTKKLQHQISSPRGEFTFRVPAGPNHYLVTATLKGFQTAREEIEIQGEEQINATLLLVPESKHKGRLPVMPSSFSRTMVIAVLAVACVAAPARAEEGARGSRQSAVCKVR